MHKFCIFLLFVIGSGCLHGQPVGYKQLTDVPLFKSGLTEASRKLVSISSYFIQEKNLSLLDEKVISKGKFRFVKENKVRMEYTEPFSYLLVINGDKVTIRDRQKSNSFSSGSNKLFSVINNIIIDCVKGTALDNKDFTHKLFASEKDYLVVLTPQKKDLKQYFNTINIYIDKKDYSVVKIDMIEPSGDNTLIRFVDKKFNLTIPDEEFSVK